MPGSQETFALMTVAELVHFRRLQKYQKRRRIQVEERLQRLQTLCAVRARLTRGRHVLRDGLAEAVCLDAKQDFATLFHSFHTIQKACDEYDEHYSPSILEGGHTSRTAGGTTLDRISIRARSALVSLVSDLASDPEFLINRILSLSTIDLNRLTKSQPKTVPDQSVLGSHSSCSSRRTTGSLRSASTPDVLDNFLDFSRHDALSLLLQIVASGNTSHGSQNCQMQTWVNVCVSLLSEQKPGGEKFVAALLTARSPELELTGKHALENWLLNTIQEGDFLSKSPEKYSFRTRVFGRDEIPTDELEADQFLNRSVRSLLDVIKNTTLTGLIPPNALLFGQKLVSDMRKTHKERQVALLCTRWLFAYLAKMIRIPESQGLLLSYHLSAHIRKRILYEVANLLEKLAFTVSHTWNHSNVDSHLLSDTEAVVLLFQHQQIGTTGQACCRPQDVNLRVGSTSRTLTLCSTELVHLVHILYPEERSQSESTTGKSHLQSSASSVSGLSLFRTTAEDIIKPSLEASCINPEGSYIILENPHNPPDPNTLPTDHASILPDLFTTFDQNCRAAELKRACEELIEKSGVATNLRNYDPLCDEWIPFHVLAGDRLCYKNKKMHHGSSDLQQPHGDTKDAVFSLLDEFVSAEGLQACPPLDTKRAMKRMPYDGSVAARGEHWDIMNDIECIPDGHSRHGQPGNVLAHFEKAASHCQQRGDYTRAHLYFRALRRHRLAGEEILSTLTHVGQTMQRSIHRSSSVIMDCETQINSLMIDQYQQLATLKSMALTFDHLREKVWYAYDVRSTGQYEDLRRIVAALRTMELPPRASKPAPPPLLRHRQGSTILNQGVQLKAEAATLEFLAALPTYGGPNKLSDTQVESTRNWMQINRIENICRGEERLHRFCQELAKCVDTFVGDSVTENPVLWSSELFRGQQRPSGGHLRHHYNAQHFESAPAERFQTLYFPHRPSSRSPDATFARQWSPPPSQNRPDSVHSASSHISPWIAQDRFSSRSPTLTDDSLTTFWSPFSTEAPSPMSVTTLPSRTLSPSLSVRSVPSRSSHVDRDQIGFLQNLKRRLTSLLLSDFSPLFRSGSETDRAMWDTLEGKEAAKHSSPFHVRSPEEHNQWDSASVQARDGGSDELPAFDYKNAFGELLRKFNLQPDPMDKLEILSDIQTLLLSLEPSRPLECSTFSGGHPTPESLAPSITVLSSGRVSPDLGMFVQQKPARGDDAAVKGFQRLFQDNNLRPKSLFRDLQYIASLLPSHILDSTDKGRAFCNATFAAVSLKHKICQSMVETADNIISYHTCSRGHSHAASALQAERDSATFSPIPPNFAAVATASAYTMADAAILLQITAREGNVVAQRELATLYLTHPEIMGRVLAPFVKPRDVFKDGMVEVKGRKDVGKYDPLTMAIAQHWMELSAKGGDSLAAKYLKAKADPLISEG